MSKFCTNCGARLADDSVFCEECGTRVERAAPSSAANENTVYQKPTEPQYAPSAGSSGGGIPKVAIIAAAAVLAVAVGAFLLLGGKGKPGSDPKTENVTEVKDNKSDSNSPYFHLKDEDQESETKESQPATEESTQADMTEAATQETDGSEYLGDYPTATGGEWQEANGVRFYVADGKIVTNSWIEDNGKAYFVDDKGHMLTDCYTPDGLYVGADGAYDPDADMGIVDIGNSNAVEIANKLSTTEIAKATDFEWFIDYVLNGGSAAGCVITDRSYSGKVTDSSYLNGGWKAYMITGNGEYGSDVERYFNVEIDTDGSYFDLTANWKYFFDPASGSSVDETHTDTFEGTYNGGTPTAESTYAKVEFSEFYISTDEKTEYAVGTFRWISGETDRIGLMRSVR